MRGVVDQNINSAPSLDDGVDDSLASSLISDILGQQDTFSTSRGDQSFTLLSIDLLFGEVYNGDLIMSARMSSLRRMVTHIGTLHGELDSGSTSNTRITSGDDGLLAKKLLTVSIHIRMV